jgi:hypothetical protein
MPPPVCTVCGEDLPDDRHPGATTCREWADAVAARLGDMMSDAAYFYLMLLRRLCQVFAAMRDGRERIDEP